MNPYDQLADLAERELDAVRSDRHEDLYALHLERDAVMAALPAHAPDEARGALMRASVAQAGLVSALAASRDAMGRELTKLRTGRGAVQAYGHVNTGLRTGSSQLA